MLMLMHISRIVECYRMLLQTAGSAYDNVATHASSTKHLGSFVVSRCMYTKKKHVYGNTHLPGMTQNTKPGGEIWFRRPLVVALVKQWRCNSIMSCRLRRA